VTAHELIPEALRKAARRIGAPADLSFTFAETRDPAHGDYATNIALVLAKALGRKPREVAELVLQALELPPGYVSKIEVAGPGFINFFLAGEQRAAVLVRVLEEGERYGRSDPGRGKKINVEFVSANPTGPLHVGHGRGAALGGGRRPAL
jgi:arginyl-tRNA synthetase